MKQEARVKNEKRKMKSSNQSACSSSAAYREQIKTKL